METKFQDLVGDAFTVQSKILFDFAPGVNFIINAFYYLNKQWQ